MTKSFSTNFKTKEYLYKASPLDAIAHTWTLDTESSLDSNFWGD